MIVEFLGPARRRVSSVFESLGNWRGWLNAATNVATTICNVTAGFDLEQGEAIPCIFISFGNGPFNLLLHAFPLLPYGVLRNEIRFQNSLAILYQLSL